MIDALERELLGRRVPVDRRLVPVMGGALASRAAASRAQRPGPGSPRPAGGAPKRAGPRRWRARAARSRVHLDGEVIA